MVWILIGTNFSLWGVGGGGGFFPKKISKYEVL